ncbi:MAG: DUF5643 domain-containing protein [Clostridia bacterium]
MIDNYKILNNEKIQFDKYSEVKTNNEKMKNLMKSKIKSRKKSNKSLLIASISALLVLSSVILTNHTTWAYVTRLVNHIESFLGKDYSEFNKYKFEGDQSIENDGLVLNLGDVMLDDKQLIVSLGIDYSNFDLEKHGFNKKDFKPDLPLITIGSISFPGQGGMIKQRDVRGEDKKELLYIVDLTTTDTDGDSVVDSSFDILNTLEKDKDYNIKIQFKNFDVGESKSEKGRWLSKSLGNWDFNTTINSSNISNDVKIIKINKVIDINEEGINHKLKIDDIRISPVSAKIKMDVNKNNSGSTYFLSAKDENGNTLSSNNNAIADDENTVYGNFELNGTEEKIIIIPIIHTNNKEMILESEKIEIDIP